MIDYANVDYQTLNKKHPDLEFWLYIYLNYRLLYRGGEEFIRAAGQQTTTRSAGAAAQTSPIIDLMAGRNRRRRFLYQLEGEPDTKYISRWERAYYIGYLPAILDYFRHWLFSQPPTIRPAEGDFPDWYEPFFNDCTGAGDRFLDFLKDIFGDVLQVRKAGWLIGRPKEPLTAQPADKNSKAPVVLTAYPAEKILDWQADETGVLQWVLLKSERRVRDFPNDRSMQEVRTFLDADSWGAWEINSVAGGDYAALVDGAPGQYDIGCVPFVQLEVPFGLWPADKLASWQISMFNQMSMLDYGQLVSCFIQPALWSDDPDAMSRVFGEGYLLNLRNASQGKEKEDFQFISPQTNALEFSAKRILEQRDEGYRIVHQMSLAVDSQAIGAIARSGASKIEDRRAAEIILCAYGGYVRDAIVKTLNMISQIVGDNTKWTVSGFDNFQVSSLEEELQTAALVSTFKIHSSTFQKEVEKKIALGRVLDHLDEKKREDIAKEIEDGIDEEEANRMAPQFMPDGSMIGATVTPTGPAAIAKGADGVPQANPAQPPVAKPPMPPIGQKAKAS